jgi:hypothetical protein
VTKWDAATRIRARTCREWKLPDALEDDDITAITADIERLLAQ